MDIQASKQKLVKMIMETEDNSLLDEMLSIISNRDLLSDQEKKAINEALEEVEREETIPHDIVMAETRKRYPQYFK